MKTATYRWLARRIFEALSFGTYDCRDACIDKARKVAAAPRTIEGVHAAVVNFAWMARKPIDSAERKRYQRILDQMAGYQFVDELPVRAAG